MGRRRWQVARGEEEAIRGAASGATYLFDDGLRESLTHGDGGDITVAARLPKGRGDPRDRAEQVECVQSSRRVKMSCVAVEDDDDLWEGRTHFARLARVGPVQCSCIWHSVLSLAWRLLHCAPHPTYCMYLILYRA